MHGQEIFQVFTDLNHSDLGLCTGQIGKFVVRRLEIAHAVLTPYIYFVLNFVNLARAFYKLSNLVHRLGSMPPPVIGTCCWGDPALVAKLNKRSLEATP